MEGRRFLLYMDILGTKELIKNGSSESLIEIVNKFSAQSKNFKIDFNEVDDDPTIRYQVNSIQPEISNFSDHILVSYPSYYRSPPYDDESSSTYIFMTSLIYMALQFHTMALEHNLLMRGALNEGLLSHVSNSVVGEALVEAADLEEKIAVYPRVVVPDKVVGLASRYGFNFEKTLLLRDFDGLYYVDYLTHPYCVRGDVELYLTKTHNIIKNNLKKYGGNEISNISGLAKWRWLANKFDGALDYFYKNKKPDQAQISKIQKFYLST